MVNEKGRVTGKSEGVANIMATTEDGGITVSCKVTVTKEAESGDKKVVSVNLDLQAMRLNKQNIAGNSFTRRCNKQKSNMVIK